MLRILLQQDIDWFAEPDPAQTRITLIVFGVLIVIGVLAAVINSRGGGSRGGSVGGLRRQARKLGLSSEQRRALTDLTRGLGLQSPERLLTNSAYLSHAMKRRIDQLDLAEMPDAERERQKSLLFSIKRTLSQSQRSERVIASSRHIRIGQTVQLRTAEGTETASSVVSNVHNGLGLDLPYQRRPVEPPRKGTPVQITFVDDNDRRFSFRSRIVGYNTARGASVMFVEHASNIRETQKRRSPRREYDRPCYFYPVTVLTTGTGRRQRKQAFVNKSRRIYGRIEDLSAGGCAIRTQVPLAKGDILKIDFENADGAAISVYGMVRGVERQRTRGRLMHIKFTRVSRKHLNQIQSYVYGLIE